MRRTLIVLLLGLSCAAMVSGCGEDPAPPAPPPSQSADDPLTDPPVTGTPSNPGKPDQVVTVTGVLSDGVEAGCLILATGSQTFQLLGVRPADATIGSRVVVTGSVRPDLMTTCQQGTALQVITIRADPGQR